LDTEWKIQRKVGAEEATAFYYTDGRSDPKLLTAHLPSKSGWTSMYSINIKVNCDPQC
jgi:hypothetical protein